MTELEKSLKDENNEELFFFFKHGGSLNFEKKIAAGKILYSRNYNKNELAIEKNKIIAAIKKQIEYYNNPKVTEKKHRRILNNNTLWGVGHLVFLLLFYVFDEVILGKDVQYETFISLGLGIVVIASIVIRIFNSKRIIDKLKKEDKKDCILQEQRLRIINNEWKF